MARVRRVEAERAPGPAEVSIEDAAAIFAAPPAQEAPVRIHIAIGFSEQSAYDLTGRKFICGGAVPADATIIMAAHEAPGFCPRCRAGAPTATGREVRVVTVLVPVR